MAERSSSSRDSSRVSYSGPRWITVTPSCVSTSGARVSVMRRLVSGCRGRILRRFEAGFQPDRDGRGSDRSSVVAQQDLQFDGNFEQLSVSEDLHCHDVTGALLVKKIKQVPRGLDRLA